jgi:hypothetical protein
MIELISIGDRLWAGEYKLHSRFKRAVNFRCDNSLIAVVDGSIGAGPFNIVTTRAGLNHIHSLTIDTESLNINGDIILLQDDLCFNSQTELKGNISYDRFFINLDTFKDFLILHSPANSLSFLFESEPSYGRRGKACLAPTPVGVFERELRNRLQLGVKLINSGNINDGVAMIKGSGYGLTPSGDDFIAGMMSGLRIAGLLLGCDNNELINSIYKKTCGGNFLSNAFLYCAKEGWYIARQKALIETLLYGDKSKIISNTKALLTIGETSGADWGAGFIITLMKAYEIL